MQQDLVIGLPQDWGIQRLHFGGHEQILVHTKTQRNRAMTLQETELKLPGSIGRLPVEVWVSRGSPQHWQHWQQQAGKVPLDINPLGVPH